MTASGFFALLAIVFAAAAWFWTVAIEPQWPEIKQSFHSTQSELSEQYPVYGAISRFLQGAWALAGLLFFAFVWFVIGSMIFRACGLGALF